MSDLLSNNFPIRGEGGEGNFVYTMYYYLAARSKLVCNKTIERLRSTTVIHRMLPPSSLKNKSGYHWSALNDDDDATWSVVGVGKTSSFPKKNDSLSMLMISHSF